MLRAGTAPKRPTALAACCLLAITTWLGAQDDETPTEVFSAAIEVELLDLQVIVTDGDGRRVHGLPAGAFRVLVDGEEAPVELFSEIRGPSTSPSGTTAAPRIAPPGPVNYLVFIDDLMTLERNRDAVLQQLRNDLSLLRPGDRMAVVRLARERKLQVLADWTSDRTVIDNALRLAMDLPAWGIKYIALRRMDGFVANWEGNDTRRSILAAAGSLRLLERPAGRRALLLIAGSWDPAEVNRAGGFSPWCVTGECERAAVYNVLTDTANLFGYAIYAIDVEGTDTDFNWGREKRLHAVLGELARVTGGRRLLNGDRRRMLPIAVEDTSSYYSIGVTPPPEAPERRMAVEIEMLRSGLEARSQTAFVPLSPERDRGLDVLAALWLEEGAEESPLRLRLGHAVRLGGGRIRVAGHLTLPADLLAWRVSGDHAFADLTIEVASLDSRGNSSEVLHRHLRLYRPFDPSPAEIVIPWPFDLPRRRHTIVAGVRDHLAGENHVTVAEIAPRDAPEPPTLASR